MAPRVDLVIDPVRNERLPITLPLSFRRSLEEVRGELGLPASVDLSDPIVAKAVGLAGAARHADPPIRFAVFGGTAHRLRCPSANDPALGLRHDLHDIDLAVLLKETRSFQRFLRSAGEQDGSALTFFETPGDRIYNSISGGQRLRWHMVVDQKGSEVALGTLDIVADAFEFCHRLDIRSDVERSPENGYTLSLARLLLAKGQFIQRVGREEAGKVADRVLEPFGRREVVIGPEAKDVRDILALLLDHPLGEGPNAISLEELDHHLGSDWGLWKTFGLNLAMIARSAIVAGLAPEVRARLEPRLAALRARVAALSPRRRLGWLGGPWWQEVDRGAAVDATVKLG